MAKLQYVRQGQPFRPSADDWNAIVDAARLRGGPVRTGGELLSIANPDPNWITVRNDDAVEMPRWGCCVLGGPVIEPGAPGDGLEGFLAQLAFTATRPVETDLPRRARLAILLEPLQPGAFGRAAIAGLVRVKLTVNSLVHTRATVVPGTDYLQTTAGEGQCTVIWTEASTGAGKWGIVQVGLLVCRSRSTSAFSPALPRSPARRIGGGTPSRRSRWRPMATRGALSREVRSALPSPPRGPSTGPRAATRALGARWSVALSTLPG